MYRSNCLQKSLQATFDIRHHCRTRCMGKIEDLCRLLLLVRGTLSAIKLLTNDFSLTDELALLLFSPNRIFDPEVRLTVRPRLISTGTRRTPKIHPGTVEVRSPCKVHSINIIEGHVSHLSIWIDPFQTRYTKIQDPSGASKKRGYSE